MERLERLIRGGALTFLAHEYSVLLPFVAVVGALLAWAIGWRTALAYAGGAICSVLAGLFGMNAATRANVRTPEAARANGQARALRAPFSRRPLIGPALASLALLCLLPL